MIRFMSGRVPFAVACGAIVLGIALPTPLPVCAQDSDKLLAEVKGAWERRQNAIRSLRMSWRIKSVVPKGSIPQNGPRRGAKGVSPPQDTTHEGTGELLLEGKKARLTVHDAIWDNSLEKFLSCRMESGFEGKRFTRLLVPESLWPMATIQNANHNADGDNLAVWPILFCVRGLDRELAMRGMYFATYMEARRMQDNGGPVVELLRPRDETHGEARVQVDPSQGMAVRRVEVYDRQGNIAFRVSITHTPAAAEVGWLPSRWTTQAYQPTRQLVKQTETVVTSVVLNPATTEGDFRIPFPPDTRVTDLSDTKADYIARADGTKRDILREERTAPHEELVKTNTGDLAPTSKSPSSWAWLWVGLGFVFALLALVFARRKFDQKRSTQDH